MTDRFNPLGLSASEESAVKPQTTSTAALLSRSASSVKIASRPGVSIVTALAGGLQSCLIDMIEFKDPYLTCQTVFLLLQNLKGFSCHPRLHNYFYPFQSVVIKVK